MPSVAAAAFILFQARAAAGASRCLRPRLPISTTTSFAGSAQSGNLRWRTSSSGMPSFASAASARACGAALTRLGSDDLEIALELPVGDPVQPLAPFPFAGGGEVLDEVLAEPVARELRATEVARRLDQRARRARNVFRADV